MSKRWRDTIQAAKAAAPSSPTAPAPAAPVPAEAAGEMPRPRMLDRKDGQARLAFEYVEGKIRGGKRSDRWGRARNGRSRDGWIGVCLPPETKKRLKRLQAQHDLYEWQVLVEAIDLFARTHGDRE